RESRRLDRVAIFALIASIQAYEQAGLENANINRDRFGVFVASGIGGMQTINEESLKSHAKGPDRVSPFFVPNAIINLIGGNIAIKFQAKGPNLPIVTACSAGTNSIGEAFRYIRDGYLDIALAGGTEAPINELGVGGFTSMRALNTSNDPKTASIPFDYRRSGFVIAEGAGVIILEEHEHAKKRGVNIYAELIGYGSTCDAYHITAPDESALGITKAIQIALCDAGIKPEMIEHINPHGTSTPYNDRLETLAFKKALGDHAYKVNISGTKSMTGHSLGATGAIEAILTIKAITDDICPPTINYCEFDPDCDLNYTPNQPVRRTVNYAINNNVGFGGQNATLIFKKYKD
ncbi:MAG: beta-ketoacyl-ACP synthase II, partial [Bacilli bacterium]|nr:beta-ketoacyl-ACP synthase II [Bacilli bacterium]